MKNYKELEAQYLAHTYARWPICIKSGQGCTLTDVEGKDYIDFTAGIGVASLGYNHKEWSQAITSQVQNLAHVSNLFYTEPMIEVAQLLCEKSGMKKVFFSNSGAEANEGAIKVARKYANEKYEGKRNTILTLVNSFHGRTLATLSATGQDSFHTKFDPFPSGFDYVVANDIDHLHEKAKENVAAIMIEMVQGEGGVNALDSAFVSEIQKICDEKDILLIVDEVQTGIGRTGSFFAYQQFSLHPDIVTSAKGLASGLPIGAILMSEKTENVFQPGDHGSTFGANPIACAGAKVVLEHMDEEMVQEVKEKGDFIQSQLEKMPHVQSVSGLGMMIGASLDVDVKEVIAACQKEGVLFLSAKDKLRLLPPLVISKEEIQKGMDVLKRVLEGME